MANFALNVPRTRRLSGLNTSRKWRDATIAYLFILPFMILYLAFTFLPILQNFWISLHNWDVIGTNVQFIGLQNYERLMQDRLFWSSLQNTIFFAVLSGPGLIIVGLALALLLNQPIRGIGVFRTLFYMPNILSVTVVGLVFARVFAPGERGLVNVALMSVGVDPMSWFLDTNQAMPTIALTKVWWSVGFNMLIFLAGLQDISRDLYEAARVDGANRWVLFRHITLPGLRRPMLFVLVLQIIASVQVFPLVEVLTGGGPAGSTRPLVMYMFERTFEYWQFGYGSALAFILFIFLFVVSMAQIWFFNRGEEK